MMCIRWENKVKFLTAEALRGVNSTIFAAQRSRIDTELGEREYVTGTALEQGCDLRQGSRGATTGANGADAGQGSEAQQSQSIDEIIDKIMEIPQLEDSEDHGYRSFQHTVTMIDDTAESSKDSADATSSLRSWLRSMESCEQVPAVKVQQRTVGIFRFRQIRRSGGHSNGIDDSDTGRCRAPEKTQKAVETTQVQFKEMNLQYRNGCRTSRRSRRLLRSHSL